MLLLLNWREIILFGVHYCIHAAEFFDELCLVTKSKPVCCDGVDQLAHLLVAMAPDFSMTWRLPEVDQLVMTLLSKHPGDRVATAEELAERLLSLRAALGQEPLPEETPAVPKPQAH